MARRLTLLLTLLAILGACAANSLSLVDTSLVGSDGLHDLESSVLIRSMNKKGLSYALPVNQFADWSWEEFRKQGFGAALNSSATMIGDHKLTGAVLAGMDVNHAAPGAGYGNGDGVPHGLMKDLWGVSWGDNGYSEVETGETSSDKSNNISYHSPELTFGKRKHRYNTN